MSIHQQDAWLLYGIQCYFSLLQLSGLVVMSYACQRARRYMRQHRVEQAVTR